MPTGDQDCKNISASYNKDCGITNGSAVDTVILDAYQTESDSDQNKSPLGYEQNLKILPRNEGGNTFSASGGTGTVTLENCYTYQGTLRYSMIYQLFFARTDSLFPAKDTSVLYSLNSTTGKWCYKDQQATATDAQMMEKGLLFHKTITAYPTSNLAKDFTSMAANTKGKKPDEAAKAYADFFNGTKQFQGLDLFSYVSAASFVRAYAWTWGLDDSGTPGRTYWLYARSDVGQKKTGTGPSPNQGSLTLTAGSTAGPPDPTDRNSGYTIQFTPNGGEAKPLYFDRGQFVDDTSVDVPAVCLTGAFDLKSRYTHKTTDTTLWPVLVGTINGTQVIGVSLDPTTWWQQNTSATTFDDVVSSILRWVGLVMCIWFLLSPVLYLARKYWQWKSRNGNKEPDEQQMDSLRQDSDTSAGNCLQDEQIAMNRLGTTAPKVPNEQEYPQALTDTKDAAVQVSQDEMADDLRAELTLYDQQVDELAKLGMTPSLQAAAQDLYDAEQALDAGDLVTVRAKFSSAETSITQAIDDLQPSQEVLNELEAAQADIDVADEAADEREDNTDDIENDDIPEEIFPPETPALAA